LPKGKFENHAARAADRQRGAEFFRHIETHEDDFLRRVMDYVRHPSISAANTGIVEVAALPTMPRTRT
jgi:hypothetical protein